MEAITTGTIIIGIIVWIVILYFIIQSATKSSKIFLQLQIQTMILAKMARNAGVGKDEINKILNGDIF